MKRKLSGVVIGLALIVVAFLVLQNENVRQSLGPLGDFLSSNGKIVFGIVIGGLLLVFFVRGRGKRKDNDTEYLTTEGTVWDAREDKTIIKYTVGSREYEKHEFDELGEHIKSGDKYTVFYNPQDPGDCFVRRNELASGPLADIFSGKKK